MNIGDVGAVTVNYNAGEHLIRCVESLISEGINKIVVVDNGSTDDSLQRLHESFPDIAVINLPNPGFGAANNVGAATLDSEFIFAINPDAVVCPGAIAALAVVLESDSTVGVVGPEILNSDGSRYPSAREFPSFWIGAGHAIVGMFFPNNRWSRRYKMQDRGDVKAGEVDWISGAAMFFRRKAFDEVGGFDTDYFMYMDDTDLCWRLRQKGWRVAYEPAASIVHVQGVSTRGRPYKMIWTHHRSLIRYHSRTTTGLGRLTLPVILAGIAVRLPIALIQRYLSRG